MYLPASTSGEPCIAADAIEQALAKTDTWSFSPALEALYHARCDPGRRRLVARFLRVAGVVCLMGGALDAVDDPRTLTFGLPLRLSVLLVCLACAHALGRLGEAPAREVLLAGSPVLMMMVLTQILGEQSGHFADRYMIAAGLTVSSLLALAPVTRMTSLAMCLCTALVFPLVPALLPGAIPLSGNWDLFGFACGTVFATALVARRNEINRRSAFLLLLRHERNCAALTAANERLERLSATDPLTGLPNRRAFSAWFDARWADRRQPLGVALLDVDWFKPYNDTAGHAEGDAALQAVATALGRVLRSGTGLAARFGGEEFVVVVHGCSPRDLRAVGERLRRAVRFLNLPHPARPGCRVSVSVGLCWCPAGDRAGGSQAGMLRAADDALYAAKRAGRDCVAMAAGGSDDRVVAFPRPLQRVSA